MAKGYTLCTGGTSNHLILWDLRPQGLTGSKMVRHWHKIIFEYAVLTVRACIIQEKVCDAAGITLNKNTVPGDRSAVIPGGVRIGSPAMTTRGLREEQFRQIADFLHRVVAIAVRIQDGTGPKLVDFIEALKVSTLIRISLAILKLCAQGDSEIMQLKAEVHAFATQFPMPGFDVASMRYKSIEA
jgi:glycine hydroxymethyltransferase